MSQRITCDDPERLIKNIESLYSKIEKSRPSTVCTKLALPSGMVVNVFDNGTVNFQGKPDEEAEKLIRKNIEAINSI